MPVTALAAIRPAILLGSYAAQLLRTRDPWPSNHGARSAQATFCVIERVITRRSFEQWLRAKLSFVGKKGMPRDIAMKLNAVLGLLHKHMA
jgi:hypothetical protein